MSQFTVMEFPKGAGQNYVGIPTQVIEAVGFVEAAEEWYSAPDHRHRPCLVTDGSLTLAYRYRQPQPAVTVEPA